jgi:uncharacterized protein with ATP-grasp and redox domains
MTMNDKIPPPLMTSEPGSYARYTVVERKPQIIQNVIDDNGFPPDIVAALEAFRDEIARQPLQPLAEIAPDVAFWQQTAAPYRGRTWLELPWFFAETYFYRRLLEVVHYFRPGDWQGHDPFASQKRDQERQAAAWLAENWEQIEAVEPEAQFDVLLHSCLWGNRADLSNLAMSQQVRAGLDVGQEQHNILVDHTAQVAALFSAGLERVDIVCDNCGQELLFDLALAGFSLAHDWAQTIVLHLKEHPFFVSDAMPRDVMALLALIQAEETGGKGAAAGGIASRLLGQRLAAQIAAGRLVLRDNPFWTTCLMFRRMPAPLAAELALADLVILKGDVNYRRLADDAHWPHTMPLEEITAYFPAPLVTLRTLKSEIMVGLEPGQAEEIAAQDPDWLINGKRGIIQYINTSISREIEAHTKGE